MAGSLLPGIIIVRLYFFGTFKSPSLGLPYIGLYRWVLYLLPALLMLTLWYGGSERSSEGYEQLSAQRKSQ